MLFNYTKNKKKEVLMEAMESDSPSPYPSCTNSAMRPV